MNRIKFLAPGAALLAACALPGCMLPYLGQQALGQLRVLGARRPVAEVLGDAGTPEGVKETLRRIADVKSWGERELGLARTGSYEEWVDTEGKPVSWLVTACAPDALEPRTWWFPVVGRVPYLGFFREEDARAEAERLRRGGDEVWVRPVLAFSTLGYFPDPVYSCFAAGDIHDVANTILHETTHATVWIRGNVELNESLADFVGTEGSKRWMRERFGEDSPEVRQSLADERETAAWRRLMLEARAELAQAFALELKTWEKVALRDAIIERQKARYRAAAAGFTLRGYREFADRPWNTAMFAAIGVYHGNEDLWRGLLDACGGDLRAFLAAAREAAAEDDFEGAVRRRSARAR